MKRLLLATCWLPIFALSAADPKTSPIRVACVGDSITAGATIPAAGFQSYPAQLQRMLGDGWDVKNFGNSGKTMLQKGNEPYRKTDTFPKALAFRPQVVVIMLGTNDTKPMNWAFKEEFVSDYQDLIAQFDALSPKPRIFVALPPFVPGAGNFGINEAGIKEELPMIGKIAKDTGATVIDVHGALLNKDALYTDRVHPTVDGATVIARTVYQALMGRVFTGPVPAVANSEWNGYPRQDFVVAGRVCMVIAPKKALPGNPWIWRPEFPGAFPSVDLALLAKGYFFAHVDLDNSYGAPASMPIMDAFYDYVTKNYHLATKVVLEGFSRGGLYAFNWAALHPGRVASIYVDAPVCDIKSWPGGKGKGVGSPADWQRCLKIYGLTEEQAMAYDHNPIDNLRPIAAARIPIIAVAGDADTDVPMAENILVAQKRYQELGGSLQLITKPGVAHHPHSLSDPKPVVDFILAHP
jgi:lysophospholipase L1-like esterase/pimeloyl-ACP methyl ester carboxylesterase